MLSGIICRHIIISERSQTDRSPRHSTRICWFQPADGCQSVGGSQNAHVNKKITDDISARADVRISRYMSPWWQTLQCEGPRAGVNQHWLESCIREAQIAVYVHQYRVPLLYTVMCREFRRGKSGPLPYTGGERPVAVDHGVAVTHQVGNRMKSAVLIIEVALMKRR